MNGKNGFPSVDFAFRMLLNKNNGLSIWAIERMDAVLATKPLYGCKIIEAEVMELSTESISLRALVFWDRK